MSWPVAFVLLLLVAAVVSLVARRLRLPYTVALVVAGLALGATHAFSAPPLTRDLMFGLVLPALVFEAAFDLEIEEVRHDGLTLAALSVPAVIGAIVITTYTLAPLFRAFDVPESMVPTTWGASVFAALISATDPVAVVALFRQLEAPRRLEVIIEAESLLNDGTAIIFFTLALAHAGTGITTHLVTDFLYIIIASLFAGGVVGLVCSEAIRRLYEPRLEVLFTTIAAYGSFVAAQEIGASGVIATVAAGLLCGSRGGRLGMSSGARIATETFWDYVAFALNSFVFLSIGLMVKLPALLEHWLPIVIAFLVVTISRGVVTWGTALILPTHLRLPRRWTAMLAWGGLRGALSMILALSIPETIPRRDLLITVTFGVVVLSNLIQGISVGPTLRRLGLNRRHAGHIGYLGTQLALLSAHSSLDDVERTGAVVAADEKTRLALAGEYDRRLDRAERALAWLGSQLGGGDGDRAKRAARRLLSTTEQERVTEAFNSGAIDEAERDRWLAELRGRWGDGAGNGDAKR
jgi:monovalent cation:H+ antiporter, CPA1 family